MALFGFMHRKNQETAQPAAAVPTAPVSQPAAASAAPAVQPVAAPAASNARPRQEMIAAISAALAEELGTDISGIRILSVKQL